MSDSPKSSESSSLRSFAKQLLNFPSVGVLNTVLVPGGRRSQEMDFHLRSGRASFLLSWRFCACYLIFPVGFEAYPALSGKDN